MLMWNARLKVYAASADGGDQGEDGEWTPAPPDPNDLVYDDIADAQDVGLMLNKDQFGTETETSDMIVFLKDESKIFGIPLDATAEVTYIKSQHSEKGRVQKVRVLDGSLLLKRV